MYDTIIIGGGIAGLYCALHTKNHLVLECNDYLGGRIFTHKSPKYESGAGRFNETHKLLVDLIRRFHLTPIEITGKKGFIYKTSCSVMIPDIDTIFNQKIKKVLKKGSKDETFFNHCLKFYTKDDVDHLRFMFGFTSEFLEMNAYDAIRLFKKKIGKYFVLKEGFSELVRRISLKVNYVMKHLVKSVREEDGIFHVDQYTCKHVVFAIPPDNLKQISFLKPVFPLLKALHTNRLIRMYAIYPNGWFEGLPAMTTNSFIRHIIPINPKSGLIMISYVEGKDTDVYLNSKGELLDILPKIQAELKVLFPDKEIINPTYFQPIVWEIGDHAWKPGYDSDKVAKQLINPMKHVYICGEAISHTQAWIEGALETATQVLDILERDRKKNNT